MIWNADTLNPFLACSLLALFSGYLWDMVAANLFTKPPPKTAHIHMAVTAVFLCLYGFTPVALRCILLCSLLIIVGVYDVMTYEIPDCLHILIAIVGLVGFQPLPALLGFVLIPLPFLIAAVKTDKIGGGDIKLMAASGFALGVTSGVWMMIWGLLIALLWQGAFRRGKPNFPLAPFLAFGGFLVQFPI
ncbi:MAG: A24 family peptidase [Oscillospiraceae bacterium]